MPKRLTQEQVTATMQRWGLTPGRQALLNAEYGLLRHGLRLEHLTREDHEVAALVREEFDRYGVPRPSVLDAVAMVRVVFPHMRQWANEHPDIVGDDDDGEDLG